MDIYVNAIRTDLELLNRLQSLSFLSGFELRELANSLHSTNLRRGEIIFREETLTAAGVHMLQASRMVRC